MVKEHLNKNAKIRLLEAGAVLFASKGFAGASVREICDFAGTGNNMIHHYFGSKQGLYEGIINQFSSEVFTVPIRMMNKTPETLSEFVSRFELFVEETLEAMITNRFLLVMIQREAVRLEEGPFVAYHLSFVSYIEQGKQRGFVNSIIDPAMLTGLVLDRLCNQVLYASTVKNATGPNIVLDLHYKAKWLRANLDLFLHGFLEN